MFSTRAGFELAANALASRIEARRASGPAFDDLSDASPAHARLVEPRCALARALEQLARDPRALGYTPDPRGDISLRRAIVAYYRRRGAMIDPAHVVLCAGTSEAYAHLFRLLGDPGDAVLVPRPSYPLFDLLASFEGLEALGYPTRRVEPGASGGGPGVATQVEGGWEIDLAALAGRAGPRTRALLAVHPHNPTGAYLAPAERRALRSLAREHGMALIVDEVFLDFPVAVPGPVSSLLADAPGEDGPLCFVLSGASKALASPQLKVAWIVVSGPTALRDEALARLELIADTFLTVSALPQLVLPSMLAAAAAVTAELGQRLRTNHATLGARLAEHRGLHLLPVAGGWTALVRIDPVGADAIDEEALVEALLDEDDVLVQPGWWFDLDPADHGGAAHLVLSLLGEPTRFDAAVTRLAARCARRRSAAA